jgi:hypothetical protein
MTAETNSALPVRAHDAVVKKLGQWTTARHFDVRAYHGALVLDLRSPRIEDGDIEIDLDIDRATVTLLVPDDAIVDHDELRRVGRGRVKGSTWAGAPGGRRIRLHGEMRKAEVRVRRAGMAIWSVWLSRQYLDDVRQARREGRLPTVDDPTRAA